MLKKLFKRKNHRSIKQCFSDSFDYATKEMAEFREKNFNRFLKWIGVYVFFVVISLFIFNSKSNLMLKEFPFVLSLVIPRMMTLLLFTLPVFILKKPKAAFLFMSSFWFLWYGIVFEKSYIGIAIALMLVIASALLFFAEKEKEYSKNKPLFMRIQLYLAYSVLMVFALQIAQMKSFVKPFEAFLLHPDVFACNILCFAAFGSYIFWVRRPKSAITIYTVFWTALAIISFCKSKRTYEPVLFLDIFSLTEGVNAFFSSFSIVFIVLMIVLAVAAVTFIIILITKEKKVRFSWVKLFSSLMFVMLVVSSLYFVGRLDFMKAESKTGKSEYDSKGFVYSFLFYSLDSFVVEPEGYNFSIIDSIQNNVENNYIETEDEKNGVQNVIAIQLESFCDPYEYPGLVLERDPMPFIRSLMNEHTSGYVSVPVFGGLTVKSEFEFITGLSIQNLPLGYSPYVQHICDEPIDSLVRYFDELGFETCAIHNYEGEFFSRHEVYKNIGFDYFVPFECMPDIEKKDAIWGNDEVFVNHIENALDNNGDGKNFVYGITVQLHGDYHPIPESEYTMNVSGVQDPEKEGAWAYYIQQLEEVDKMVKDLIEMLSNREESTYVIFYGDHLPSIFVGAGDNLSTKQKYATPYFTWNNMGIKKAEGTNADSGKYEPDIKLYQLSTLMCNELNLSGSFMNRFHNIYKDSSSFNHEFSCIQYYKMYDENKNVTFTNDTYQIGMLPFSIEEITFDSESLSYHIKGEGFTQDTYFCVDNKTVYNVKFIDGNNIIVSDCDEKFESDTQVSLKIIGSKIGNVLKQTKNYKWGSVYAGKN